MISDFVFIFLLGFAISDYLSLRVEILVSGISLLWIFSILYKYVPMIPVVSVLFVVTVILAVSKNELSVISFIAMTIVGFYYVIKMQNPLISETVWLFIGMTIGLIDNVVFRISAVGDIMITTMLFIGAGPFAFPIYVAQYVIGNIVLERYYEGRKVYPMGTAVFIGYVLALSAIDYMKFLWSWIL